MNQRSSRKPTPRKPTPRTNNLQVNNDLDDEGEEGSFM
jgi:hypothetical protein